MTVWVEKPVQNVQVPEEQPKAEKKGENQNTVVQMHKEAEPQNQNITRSQGNNTKQQKLNGAGQSSGVPKNAGNTVNTKQNDKIVQVTSNLVNSTTMQQPIIVQWRSGKKNAIGRESVPLPGIPNG